MKPRALALSLLGITAFLVFIQAGAPSLDTDGIHYAAVAEEIAGSGRWLLPFDPVMNTHHYWHFPLTIWTTALFFQWFGISAGVAKLYSMGMTVAAVAGLFALGRALAGPWTGWFAGMAFLGTNHVLRIARQCRVDLPLVAWIIWAFYGLVRAQAGSKAWYLLAGLASLGAVMTKEVVGLVPLVAGTAYLILRRRWRELTHPAFLAAWGIALGPVFGWIALERALYGDTLWRNYYAQNFSHLYQANPLGTPWYYYGWAILDKYGYLLPFALAGGWIALQRVRRGEEPRWLLIFLWAVAFPLGFSLAQHKVHYYILPTYAATALWVGLLCERWIPPLWRGYVLKGAVAVTALAALALTLHPVPLHKTRYPETLGLVPRLDPILAEAPGEVIVAGTDAASLLFYSSAVTRVTNAHHPEQFRPLLAQPCPHRRYCVISRENWNSLDPDVRAACEVLEESDRQLLIRQQPSRTDARHAG